MPASDPRHRICHLEDVFQDMFGEPLCIAQGSDTRDVNVGESGGIRKPGAIHVRYAELCAQVFPKVEGQSVDSIAEKSAVQIIEQAFRERVGVTKSKVLRTRLADAGTTIGSSP